MEWHHVRNKLPIHEERVLGYCINHNSITGESWQGIVDVNFFSNTGWMRCENRNDKVFVTHWFDYPIEPTNQEDEIEESL